MYDSRLNLCRQVAEDAKEYFGVQVFRTPIPRNVRLAEAPSFGQPILLYDVQSVGARSYLAVGQELIRRIEQPESLSMAEADTQEMPAAAVEERLHVVAASDAAPVAEAVSADVDDFPPDDAPLDDLMSDAASPVTPGVGDTVMGYDDALDDASEAGHDPLPADATLSEVSAGEIVEGAEPDDETGDAPMRDDDPITESVRDHTESAEAKP
jgi:hypothetical protein